jgi:hypothetical protein
VPVKLSVLSSAVNVIGHPMLTRSASRRSNRAWALGRVMDARFISLLNISIADPKMSAFLDQEELRCRSANPPFHLEFLRRPCAKGHLVLMRYS